MRFVLFALCSIPKPYSMTFTHILLAGCLPYCRRHILLIFAIPKSRDWNATNPGIQSRDSGMAKRAGFWDPGIAIPTVGLGCLRKSLGMRFRGSIDECEKRF